MTNILSIYTTIFFYLGILNTLLLCMVGESTYVKDNEINTSRLIR